MGFYINILLFILLTFSLKKGNRRIQSVFSPLNFFQAVVWMLLKKTSQEISGGLGGVNYTQVTFTILIMQLRELAWLPKLTLNIANFS